MFAIIFKVFPSLYIINYFSNYSSLCSFKEKKIKTKKTENATGADNQQERFIAYKFCIIYFLLSLITNCKYQTRCLKCIFPCNGKIGLPHRGVLSCTPFYK